MGYKYVLIALSLFILTFSSVSADNFVKNWDRTYSGLGFDEGRSIAYGNNSVFVAGISLGVSDAYYLLKYSEEGRFLWDREVKAQIWNRSLRNVAILFVEGGLILACTNGTFNIYRYDADGNLIWEREWGKANTVTDIALDGKDVIISGISEGRSEQESHIIKCSIDGSIEWNVTVDGRIMGICVHNDSIFAAGCYGNESRLFKMDNNGNIIWNRSYGKGVIEDVAAGNSIYLLLSYDNISVVKCDMNGNALQSSTYGEKSAGHSICLDKNGNVFVAGSVYNESSKDVDYLILEYAWDGKFIRDMEYNGGLEDEAWDVYVDGGIFATGYSVITKIVDMNAVSRDRDFYTTSYSLKNIPPEANFSWSPEEPEAGKDVEFKDASYDVDGSIVSWKWSFGDGKFSNSKAPVHKYKNGGTYKVNLTVFDDAGGSASIEKTIVVKEKKDTPGFEFIVLMAAFLVIFLRKNRLIF